MRATIHLATVLVLVLAGAASGLARAGCPCKANTAPKTVDPAKTCLAGAVAAGRTGEPHAEPEAAAPARQEPPAAQSSPQAVPAPSPVPPPPPADASPLSPADRRALEDSRVVLEEAVGRAPDSVELWQRLGLVYQGLGSAEEARRAFEKVVELRPEDAAGWYMLGLVYEKLFDPARAITAWEKCLRRSVDPEMAALAKKHLEFLRTR
ncbi:MAG: tetratricopeptide repeat protein [Elusimicrobiota bacterium]